MSIIDDFIIASTAGLYQRLTGATSNFKMNDLPLRSSSDNEKQHFFRTSIISFLISFSIIAETDLSRFFHWILRLRMLLKNTLSTLQLSLTVSLYLNLLGHRILFHRHKS